MRVLVNFFDSAHRFNRRYKISKFTPLAKKKMTDRVKKKKEQKSRNNRSFGLLVSYAFYLPFVNSSQSVWLIILDGCRKLLLF